MEDKTRFQFSFTSQDTEYECVATYSVKNKNIDIELLGVSGDVMITPDDVDTETLSLFQKEANQYYEINKHNILIKR